MRANSKEDAMADWTHKTIETNGINMHYVEQGEGPLVVLCHGFPESWYSWRHQIPALAEAGYHVVVPDQRGYGKTTQPEEIDQYTQFHLVGDIVGLLDGLGEEQAVIVGHDWGAPVAWNSALLRPDRFRAVAALSVPFGAFNGQVSPLEGMKMMAGENFFYILYFQTPGVAEHELYKDVRRTMRMLLYSASGDSQREAGLGSQAPKRSGFLDQMTDPDELPPWLTEEDLDVFTAEFEEAGFFGGLNWYRNIDRTWRLMGAYAGSKVQQPALFVSGTRDLAQPPMIEAMKAGVPNLREIVWLEDCGHWTQQERPNEVNEALIGFLDSLD
jgi:epoxide hydrolase A/B